MKLPFPGGDVEISVESPQVTTRTSSDKGVQMRNIIAIDGRDSMWCADHVLAMAVLRGLQGIGIRATMHCKHESAGTCCGCWYDNQSDDANAASVALAAARANGADYETIRRLERAYDSASNMGD